jgi:hypothetical protein
MTLDGTHARVSLFPGTPGTPGLESWNCPETVLSGVPGLWELITPDCGVWSQRGLNQTCSPRWDLSKDVSHSPFGGREEVDSRLLVVGSQTASLTPGPSFAHNLGYRCPNGQCEAIFYIYASRPFQWHQEHLNARCFGPCCRALNIRESRRTPNPHFFQVLGFTPTLGQSRVVTLHLQATASILLFLILACLLARGSYWCCCLTLGFHCFVSCYCSCSIVWSLVPVNSLKLHSIIRHSFLLGIDREQHVYMYVQVLY